MQKIRTLVIKFQNNLNYSEIPLFRGAIIGSITDKDILFHNHEGDGYRYKYPLIQYKRIKGNAALVCVSKGVDTITKLFEDSDFTFKIGQESRKFDLDYMHPNTCNLQLWDDEFRYNLRRWIPLNSKNYDIYMSFESLVEKISFLERILKGNILSFCKSMNYYLKEELKCSIVNIDSTYSSRAKNIKQLCFDIEFKTNIYLPDYIGLGKHVSIGYGVIHSKVYKREQ